MNSIYQHVLDAEAMEGGRARREAVRRALIESCSLLQDVNQKALRYELEQLVERAPSIHTISGPPLELEEFLEAERELLGAAGLARSTIQAVEDLIHDVHLLTEQKIIASDLLSRFRTLQRDICTWKGQAVEEAKHSAARTAWFGVAGVALVVIDVAASSASIPVATMSVGFGSGLMIRAMS